MDLFIQYCFHHSACERFTKISLNFLHPIIFSLHYIFCNHTLGGGIVWSISFGVCSDDKFFDMRSVCVLARASSVGLVAGSL